MRFADCFGWVLRPASQHRCSDIKSESEQHAGQNGHPSGVGQVADLTNLIGLASAPKAPSDFGKVLSL